MDFQRLTRKLSIFILLSTLLAVSGILVQAADADDVLTLVNAERALNSQPALTLNAQLNAAALRHANDMVNNSFFSHTGSDCSTASARISEAGYTWSAAGENIASGQISAAAVVTAWMNSAGHRANILSGSYTNMGLARVGNIWVQTFGNPGGGSGVYDAACLGGGGGISGTGGASNTGNGEMLAPLPTDDRLNQEESGFASVLVYCIGSTGTDGVEVWQVGNDGMGTKAVSATGTELSNALSLAVQTGAPALIASSGSVSLYALESNQLQAQAPEVNAPEKLYKYVFAGNICGDLPAASTPVNNQPATTNNTTTAITPASTTTVVVPVAGQGTHTVQAGENLFRIALRYGTSFTILAQLNNITDPTRIFPGQILILPQ